MTLNIYNIVTSNTITRITCPTEINLHNKIFQNDIRSIVMCHSSGISMAVYISYWYLLSHNL
jgi:hypothetical protein